MGQDGSLIETRANGLPDWRDRICSSFVDLDCEDVDPANFFGSVASRQCDMLQFARVESTRQRVVRSKSRIAHSNADDFLLSLQLSGHGQVRQADREAYQSPGDFVIYDTSRPYELSFHAGFKQLILTLPRRTALRFLPKCEDLTAVCISGSSPTTRLAAAQTTILAKQCAAIPNEVQRIANEAMFEMLAMAFCEHFDASRTHGLQNDPYERAITFIKGRLTDPDLKPIDVAHATGISQRYLNLIFARREQSVSRTIWNMRIKRAARDLLNPALNSVSITSIAFSLGFNDMAHFTRSFKAVYGETPSRYRAGAHGR